MGTRNANYDAANTAPTWSSNTGHFLQGYLAQETGTSKDPKLVVLHSAAPSAPTSLLTEGQTNPTNVTDASPEFSAIYEDANSGDSATDYQIQVATSTAFTDIYWDSGKIALPSTVAEGTRSPDLPYAGQALATSTTYHWRLKFWDDNEVEGTWSTEIATFALNYDSYTGGAIQDLNFAYDPVGNITQIADHSTTGTGKVVNYAYDDLHRLISASTTAASSTPYSHTYEHTSIGNISSSTPSGAYAYQETGYANPHAATQIATTGATTTFTYDSNGNMETDGIWTYGWDYRNRLISAGNGSATTTFSYSHDDQRVKKRSGGVDTIYVNKFYEKQGATSTAYIWAGDTLVAIVEGNGQATSTTYAHTDHLNSVSITTDENGAVKSVKDFYPYGSERISETYSGNAPDRTFLSRYADSELDLSYLTARYYSDDRGQFISQDPVHLAIGDPSRVQQITGVPMENVLADPQLLHSYGYARNNPLKYSDPDGKFLDVALDVGFIAYDLYRVGDAYFNGGDVQAELGYLGLDIAGAATPFAAGLGVAGRVANTASQVNRTANAVQNVNAAQNLTPNLQQALQNIKQVDAPYVRPPNATNQLQKTSVQGQPCVNCGTVAPKMYADHKTPLVMQYYTTGKIDTQAMKSTTAVQPQCPSCSAKQGGILSAFSKTVKSILGLK